MVTIPAQKQKRHPKAAPLSPTAGY